MEGSGHPMLLASAGVAGHTLLLLQGYKTATRVGSCFREELELGRRLETSSEAGSICWRSLLKPTAPDSTDG